MDTENAAETTRDIDISGILEHIPHRYPFLMIDRVTDVVLGASAVGLKNVTINEPFFQGHFPTRPVMPGVLLVEAMAQTAAVLVCETLDFAGEGKLVYFMSIENARFRKPVFPGDTLRIPVEVQHHRSNVWKFKGEAWVGETLMAEAVYTAMIVDN